MLMQRPGIDLPSSHSSGNCSCNSLLCRYIARPLFSADRLTLTARGRMYYELRRPWRDGTTHVTFDALVFLEFAY